MISESALLNKLKAFVETDRGKKMLAASSAKKSLPTQQMNAMARDLIRMIQAQFPDSIKGLKSTLKYSAPIRLPNGGYQITISFDRGKLQRDSLFSEGYPSGVTNIVALFNNGYEAEDKTVFGIWNIQGSSGGPTGEAYVDGRMSREPLQFMQKAQEEFNSKYKGKYNVIVELGSDYER